MDTRPDPDDPTTRIPPITPHDATERIPVVSNETTVLPGTTPRCPR